MPAPPHDDAGRYPSCSTALSSILRRARIRPVAVFRVDPPVLAVDAVLHLPHPRHPPAPRHSDCLTSMAADQSTAHLVRPPATSRIRDGVHSFTSSHRMHLFVLTLSRILKSVLPNLTRSCLIETSSSPARPRRRRQACRRRRGRYRTFGHTWAPSPVAALRTRLTSRRARGSRW